jgi:transcriptional regulator with XRE-family HTH domain
MFIRELNPIDTMVGGRLETERRRAGWSVASLCEAIEVDEIRYRRFETGRERIDARSLQKICMTLGVSPVVLFRSQSPGEAMVEERPRWVC